MAAPVTPLVSIIIASYNHSDYVGETIRSALAQTYDNIQLIVIDDASADDSAVRIAALQREGEFLFLQNEKNIGLQRTLGRALQEVKGEYLSWFASDDMILPQKIELLTAFMQQRNLDGVYASGFVLYPDGRQVPMDMGRVEQMFSDGTYLDHVYVNDSYGAMFQSGLFKTKALKEVDSFRQSFWSDDWAVTIKLLENYRIGFLNEPTVIYRVHERNSYKKYWDTFPGRVQVVSLLSPLKLRHKALGNLFLSQAAYLEADDDKEFAKRFYFAALAMDFTKENLMSCVSLMNIKPQILKRIFLRIVSKLADK